MSWDRLLRMFRLREDEVPDLDEPNPALDEAREKVEDLHVRAEKVLDDYAAANGKSKH